MSKITRVSRFGFVNCYLVGVDDGLTLVDTMIPRSSKTILAAAQRLGKPIARIVITHAHGDHIGSLDALAEAVPDAEVLVSARDARLLHKVSHSTRTSRRQSCAAVRRGPGGRHRARSRRGSASARLRSWTPRATRRVR